MNPNTSTAAAPASLLHDVSPPASEPQVANPVATAGAIKTEVAESIPVKMPGGPAPAPDATTSNPMTGSSMQPQAPPPVQKADQALDKDLRTVNRRMKVSEAHEKQQAKSKRMPGTNMALPVGLALVAAGVLMFFAVSAYRHPQTAIRTRGSAGLLLVPIIR